MLMITETHLTKTGRSLKLEGKLLGPWVDELCRTCEVPEIALSGLWLDLSAVTFVDSAGVRVLDDLIRRGARVIACSGFVAEMLNLSMSASAGDSPAQNEGFEMIEKQPR
jgi:ABC-type transporter Mla MlaB component